MALLQQLTELLSQPPGTIIYHLVTLLALQVVFAVCWSQWRRNRLDGAAQRMALAAGAIWLLRVLVLGVGLADGAAGWLLPPLTQIVETVTAVFLLWSLSIQSAKWPRPSDTLLGIALIFIIVLSLFFAQSWQTLTAVSTIYPASQQALFWLIFQITLYGIGLLLALLKPEGQRSLRPFIFLILLAAPMVQLALPPAPNSLIWQRLADFIALPLWAALAYRHVLLPLLQAEAISQSVASRLATLLRQASQVAQQSFDSQLAIRQALQLVQQQIDISFIAIALLEKDQLRVLSNRPQPHEDQPQSWLLALSHWPALRTAVDSQQRLELKPNGLGARQLHQLYVEFGLPTTPLPPLIVEPLVARSQMLGLLLISPLADWSEADGLLLAALAEYIANLLVNGRRHQQLVTEASEKAAATEPPPVGTGRIIALETDNKRLQEELQIAWDRLYQEEQRTTFAQQRARDLAATIEESLQSSNQSDEIARLRTEIESLRESLIQAEEAVAMASAADSGLTTEWVMHTITRYSGELEEAQSRIGYLEMELHNRRDDSPRYAIIASLGEELRTPLTSIAGYTDLLLGESVGKLAGNQQKFLQRVRTNTERLAVLLEQVIRMAMGGDAAPIVPDEEPVDTREVIESAVHAVISRMQDKNLHLEMDVPDVLEPVAINREALQQIMIHLLNNACQSSRRNGRITITARSESLPPVADELPLHFLRIAITDSGSGIHPADHSRVFEPHLQTNDPLIEGLGDTAAGLAVARSLTTAYGGRIWVDSEIGQGSTFSLVFPFASANGFVGR